MYLPTCICKYLQDFRDRLEPFQTILIHIVIKYVCSTSELPEVTWSLAIATFSTPFNSVHTRVSKFNRLVVSEFRFFLKIWVSVMHKHSEAHRTEPMFARIIKSFRGMYCICSRGMNAQWTENLM